MLDVQYYCSFVIHRENFSLSDPASAREPHLSIIETNSRSAEKDAP